MQANKNEFFPLPPNFYPVVPGAAVGGVAASLAVLVVTLIVVCAVIAVGCKCCRLPYRVPATPQLPTQWNNTSFPLGTVTKLYPL